jgi:hypothetical protein
MAKREISQNNIIPEFIPGHEGLRQLAEILRNLPDGFKFSYSGVYHKYDNVIVGSTEGLAKFCWPDVFKDIDEFNTETINSTMAKHLDLPEEFCDNLLWDNNGFFKYPTRFITPEMVANKIDDYLESVKKSSKKRVVVE